MITLAKRRAAHFARLALCLVLSAPLGALVGPSSASGQTTASDVSDWDICNDTSYVVRSASAYERDGRMVAQGWREILPGECITEAVPTQSGRFLFAESLPLHQGGIREWKGDTQFCASNEDFSSDISDDCGLNALISRGYLSVRPDEPQTRLRETADYSPESAKIAVQQRLLRDIGYDVSVIDGLAGQGTARLLRQFRVDAELDRNLAGDALIRALMRRAVEVNAQVGLEVCNESSQTVWSALATRESGNWRSRGWWRTEPAACTKIMTTPLPGTQAHVYATQERPNHDGVGSDGGPDRRLRSIATTPAQFCISEAEFDAIGNELCVEQGYAIASFRAAPTDADGARMRLTDADFSDPDPNGLRR